nr:reverse transcriptase domain-containing protein [Tanacetum cinerariifolium]
MQHAFKGKISSGKGHPARVLLANNAPGCKRRNTQVPLMPDPLPNPQAAQNTDDVNHSPLAILPMGDGCARAIAGSPGESEIRNRSCGLFHKVDRGQTASQNDKKREIGMPTHRTMTIKEGEGNEEETRLNLDLLTERREAAAIREARYKMKMEQYYNKRVRPMSFKVGEYVYRKNEASRVENLGKLGPKWEGPYLIVEAYQNGSYKLRTMNDMEAAPHVRERQISSYIT